jgi:hypothetical protein
MASNINLKLLLTNELMNTKHPSIINMNDQY